MKMELPAGLAEGATLAGNEYAWGVADFPKALRRAVDLGYACLGGQFQFRAPRATCEMYWLDVESSERGGGEPWARYVERACEEVSAGFQKLIAETDFEKEARGWKTVPELSGPGAQPGRYLCFVAYFVSEPEADAPVP